MRLSRTFLDSGCSCIYCDGSGKLGSIVIGGTLHDLVTVAPIAESVGLRIKDVEEWTEDGLHKSTDEDVYALDLLILKIGLDMDHRVLGEQFTKLELGVV